MSETAKDTAIVAIDEYKTMPRLSNGTIFNET